MKTIHIGSVVFSIIIIVSLGLSSCAFACVSPTGQEPVIITLFDQDQHLGVDIKAQAGSSVCAVAPGKVYWAGTMPNGIQCISIADKDGLRTTYLPVAVDSRFSSWQDEDIFIDAGEKLGTLETGDKSSKYDHLHLGLKTGRGREARYLDPLKYFDFEWPEAECASDLEKPEKQPAVLEHSTATLPPLSLTGMEPDPTISEPEPCAGEIPEPESHIEDDALTPDPSSSIVSESGPEQEISQAGEPAGTESPEVAITPIVQLEQLPSPVTPASSEVQIINELPRETGLTVSTMASSEPIAAESASVLPPVPVIHIDTSKTVGAPRQTEVMPAGEPASLEKSTKFQRHRPDAIYHQTGKACQPVFLLPVALGVIMRRRITDILHESLGATKTVLIRTGRIIALNASMSLPGPG